MKHLRAMLAKADEVDRREGMRAYGRYHAVMKEIADRWRYPLDRVVAAFVALSPNSDYYGNLRSLVSCLEGLDRGLTPDRIVVSTYGHCRDRACAYLEGDELFWWHAKGLKTRNFYMNVLEPENPDYVTVDGHMFWAHAGRDGTMKEAKVSKLQYQLIKTDCIALASEMELIPNQLQAMIWFARKRSQQIKYNAQLSLFYGGDDQWQTHVRIEDLRPYPVQSLALGTV